jgi:hypothetical protein
MFHENDNTFHKKKNHSIYCLSIALRVSLLLQKFVSCIPIAVISHIGYNFAEHQQQLKYSSTSSTTQSSSLSIFPKTITTTSTSLFTSRATSASVLGTSFGKMIHGPMIDIIGARRTSIRHSILLGTSLLLLTMATSATTIIYACFLVEFMNSVQC